MGNVENKNQEKLNKADIPICPILSVNIAAINMEWLLNFTNKYIKELSGHYMCVSNVHTTVLADEDEIYKSILNNGIMAIPDGGPLSMIGRRRGYRNIRRTTGPSYMGEIFSISAQNGWSHYFYGSTEETLSKMNQKLVQTYPGIKIAGMYSPPFRALTDEENQVMTIRINEADADFVWVGLGAPKQEKWMADHQWKVKGFMVGVGAGFDYFAGNIKRAPSWMQKSNLEWLYRLIQNPRRLFMRYLVTNVKFIWRVFVIKK